MTGQEFYIFIKSNQLMIGLLSSAIIGTMPEMLPGWRQFPQWTWTWIRDAAKTFLNFRHQSPTPPPSA